MVALSQKFSTSSLKFIPKQFCQYHLQQIQFQTTQPFIPFSQLQNQRNLLESHLISTLNGCTSLAQIKQTHAYVIRKGLDQCCYILTKLVRILTKMGIPMDNYAKLVFDQVEYPNPFLWTALIRGYALQGHVKKSVCVYSCMREEGSLPVSFTFSALFKACCTVLDVNLGRQIHTQTILIGGFSSDLYVNNSLIDMYVKLGFLGCARKVFDELPEKDLISWTELIVAYAELGDMESAGELFDKLPIKDMVAWTAMVTGYAQNAKPREALEFFERMQNEGVETDEVTLVGVISACAQLGAAKYANWVRGIAENSGFDPTRCVVVGSALIDMYSKCGSVEDAYKVFEAMEERNVFSYSSMIAGFAMHGCAFAAFELFHEMLKTGIKPNRVTFIGVLTACSHTGMVEQGRQIFASMEEEFGVSPAVDHYACMVDLLGRAGCLEEALNLAETMPLEPNGGVWGALLGACRTYGNPDIAQIAANHLFELEPNAIGNYILLSNIYASAGRWNDVSTVRKLMREKGLRKNPACSWLEAKKGVIHEFFAGDMTNPRSGQMKQELEDLLNRLKALGYQPNMSSVAYDVNDEEKRRLLMAHSEKLALAFGLLTISADWPIKIMKNLRICEDCHLFMCGVSQITGRVIIVRDNLRFHHFQAGKCSCGNFW
ncbi:pentatricopeptide repeat-containing protein At5g44230 [Herrania umbratica]|uniref:Pentatricopeptide repeat-containing protein At5g44230 n=1 Tax=Herrania umbratica TaxID=108875 RepID=A0A6J0ZHK8_9ROSI|nr:pentatricopeptide repeat-containing protein At5g44230 [Herrania umbratica]